MAIWDRRQTFCNIIIPFIRDQEGSDFSAKNILKRVSHYFHGELAVMVRYN